MKRILLLFSLVLGTCVCGQEETAIDSLSFKSIDDLSFMKGTWEGDGWIFINREKKEFTQKETIMPKVKNSILVIDGLGYSKDSTLVEKQIIHDAYGIISFDKEEEKIVMLSYSTTGGKMENEMLLVGNKKLQWSFKDERGGTIRFSEDFSETNKWVEKGEYSFDGNKWFPFFQMTLYKQ